MRAPDIVEAWKWRDPGEQIERLLRESERVEQRILTLAHATTIAPLNVDLPESRRDRYYTQARKLHVKQTLRTAMSNRR